VAGLEGDDPAPAHFGRASAGDSAYPPGMPPLLALLRWLGPWTPADRVPPRVEKRSVPVEGGSQPFEAMLYRPPGRPRGAYLIAPGLNPGGPSDPRFDRFCAVLAEAGFVTLAPFLPDYTHQRVLPRAVEDFARTFDAFVAQPEVPAGTRPALFTLSLGSLLGLRLASDPRYAERVSGVLVFGGYADWEDTIRFTLTGEADGRVFGKRDPLNTPAVFTNLIEAMPGAPADVEPLRERWRDFCLETWGHPELKEGGRYLAIAERLADELPEHLRDWFLVGCGARPGAIDLSETALEAMRGDLARYDPRVGLEGIRCPVHVVHGVDDDVIPYTESEKLAAILGPLTETRLYMTGLYGHTAHEGADVLGILREARTLLGMLGAIASLGRTSFADVGT